MGEPRDATSAAGYQFAKRPPEVTFGQFLYNSGTGEILGRTPISWLQITLFYIVYYSFLTAFFIGMLLAFFQTLDEKEPTWKGEAGLIGSNPGMGFRPEPPYGYIESTLIWFRHGIGHGTWEPWVDSLEYYAKNYKSEKYSETFFPQADCGDLAVHDPGRGNICKVKPEELFQGPCTKENNYGFRDGRPCVLLKLNRIIEWIPEPIDEEYLPKGIPRTIMDQIEQNKKDGNDKLNDRVWIDCQGENPADKENIGPLTYYPTNGISRNYFPYLNQEGYRSPAIFVEFADPRHGVLIAVECKAWANNIHHDRMKRMGLVHFELMID